ncbi:hypothetical protein HYW32_03810 [Candidatus Berkelbacteria bacterium]|nr:hypothetical protein [Candidatus Berkelbacteria bacterium]
MRVMAAVAAVALMSGAGSAWADVDLSAGNDITGPDSVNRNDFDITDDLDLDIDNDADADNDIDLDADSGDNTIDSNTTVGDFEGGDIEVEGEFVTELNTGEVMLGDMELGDVDADFSNDTTGPNSDNRNTLDIDRTADIDVDNDADIDNDFDVDVDTGGNDITNNTTVGDIETGDFEMELTVENTANMGASQVTLPSMGDQDVDADFSNDTTGPNSVNRNTLDVDNTLNVDVDNDADVDNDLDVDVDSGDNTVDSNTTVGDITTGDVSINFSFTNILN